MAEAGEFTKRAYLSGRIDLSQAEAVAEIISANNEVEAEMAGRILDGGLKSELEIVTEPVISLLADLEVSLDFPDEDLEIINPVKVCQEIEKKSLKRLNRIIRVIKTEGYFGKD